MCDYTVGTAYALLEIVFCANSLHGLGVELVLISTGDWRTGEVEAPNRPRLLAPNHTSLLVPGGTQNREVEPSMTGTVPASLAYTRAAADIRVLLRTLPPLLTA